MKKKLIVIISIIILVGAFCLIKFPTIIYLGFEWGDGTLYTVNMTVKIDGETIYDDISVAPAWSGINVKKKKVPLRLGMHRIVAESADQQVYLEQDVFILFNYYIMVEFWERPHEFTVRTGFNPFRFE